MNHCGDHALATIFHHGAKSFGQRVHLVAWSSGFNKVENGLSDSDVAAEQRGQVYASGLDVRANLAWIEVSDSESG